MIQKNKPQKIYHIDVGDMPPEKAIKYVEDVRRKFIIIPWLKELEMKLKLKRWSEQ